MRPIITQLAEPVAERTRGFWTAGTVLQHLALRAEDDDHVLGPTDTG